MARKSLRLSEGTKASPAHKRGVSSSAISGPDSKKVKAHKTTPTKSQYFDDDEDDDASPSSSDDEDVSDFNEDGEADEVEDATDPDEGDDASESEVDSRGPRKKPTPGKSAVTSTSSTTTKGHDGWREGVSAGLGPGKQLIIKKPKARSAGKIPYEDETIHPNTLLFLEELKQNNQRQWLKMHDADFRQSERDWHSFVGKLSERLVEIDDTLPELPVKDVIFRIYRDVRFSPDPTPYKPYFSVAFSRTGRKGPYAHYYIQIAPDESFVGGGLWQPEAGPVAAMRRDIDSNPRRIKDVLRNDGIRKEFLKGAARDDKKVVKSFVVTNSQNALKTKPKGYDAEHADIDLLRLKNYTIGRKLGRDEVLGERGLDRVVELLTCMRPFITYLNSVIMPDETPESEEGESGEGSDEDEDDDDE